MSFSRLIIWLCKRFNREELLNLIDELIKILKDENPDIKPKDAFKEKHPNYRDFYVDPMAPLDAAELAQPKKTKFHSVVG
jgi:hypothetical protein